MGKRKEDKKEKKCTKKINNKKLPVSEMSFYPSLETYQSPDFCSAVPALQDSLANVINN